jgi:RNA polymerase sigma-54 factor
LSNQPAALQYAAMSQGLQLTQSLRQSLVLAPQMQQSLALLQAPILELKALVEQELQQNPVLEEEPGAQLDQTDPAIRERAEAAADPAEPPADVKFDPATEKETKPPADDFQAEFDHLAQVDEEWREHFSQTNAPLRGRVEDEEKRQFMMESLTAGTSLQEELLEQMRLSELAPEQWPVAEMIIGNIDENGYLKSSVDELVFATNVERGQIEAVLKVIQGFHPPGIGARDLRECLLLQLERQGRGESLEYRMIRDQMNELGRRRFPEIARALNVTAAAVQDAALRIAHLDPRPGRSVASAAEVYIVPEVFVQQTGDEYVVTVNEEHLPRLRISNLYKDLMADTNSSSEDRDYIRNKIQAGKFLIKSIQQRQQTILNIAREIVKRQQEFMEQGVSALKPMTMAQVAEVVGVHETTVSRAVSGKYIETPKGIFEMRYFFTSGLQTDSGTDVSNASVKDMIAALFKDENPAHPLSDEEVVKMLKEKGIMIARRTVAKYRAELGILPSNLRRVY